MTTVFISGSREIPYLPEEAKRRIDRIMERDFDVVVGDSERGVDFRVIDYLRFCEYQRVAVYTIHGFPRIKDMLPQWTVCHVEPTVEKKVGADGRVRNARDLETSKDEAMGKVANYGLVVWSPSFKNRYGRESASRGSLRNMYQLLHSEKPVVLYKLEDVGETFSCIELRNVHDLKDVVAGCPAVVRNAYDAIVKRYGGQPCNLEIETQLRLLE